MEDLFQMHMEKGDINAISNVGLAHIGDGVYELMCRSYLCARGSHTLKRLHHESIALVKASTQARFAEILLPYLTEEEQSYYRRGKDAHTHAAPMAATPREYAKATGLETLFGALYLAGKTQRLNELFGILMEAQYGL